MKIDYKNAAINLAMLGVSCSIGLFILEGYFRIFKPQSIMPRFVESAPYGIRKNMPNIRGFHKTSEFRYQLNTNSQGFRGTREYTVEKPPNTLRIIVLGDSVAMGHGVSDDETFSALLESALNNGGIKAEVINMGVSGFGTAEELIQYENLGRKYHPDIVILSYFPNDPYNNTVSKLYKISNGILVRNKWSYEPALRVRDNLNKIPFYNFLAQHSHLLCFIRSYVSGLYISRLGEKGKVWAPAVQGDDMNVSDQSLELTTALLNAFKDVCRKDGVKLVFLDIPEKSLKSNFPYKFVREDEFSTIVDIASTMRKSPVAESLWYIHDGHPRSSGHACIAMRLLETISSTTDRSLMISPP